MKKVAYLFKARGGGFELIICDEPCNGLRFQNSETLKVAGKREANTICKERNVTPYNW